jgi:hypothetical protein
MLSIKDFTDNELKLQIETLLELIDTYEYGSSDYNAAESELRVARQEKYRRDTIAAEAKEKLVLEYLNLSCEFIELETSRSRQAEIKIRLNEIRSELKMKTLP